MKVKNALNAIEACQAEEHRQDVYAQYRNYCDWTKAHNRRVEAKREMQERMEKEEEERNRQV